MMKDSAGWLVWMQGWLTEKVGTCNDRLVIFALPLRILSDSANPVIRVDLDVALYFCWLAVFT
jgi:hypothetical protein